MATAKELLGAGSTDFFLVARNTGRVQTVADDLRARGAKVGTASRDLDDTDGHAALIDAAAAAMGGIDLALLAHGVLGEQKLLAENYAATEALMVTNVMSPISLLTLLGNRMGAERAGTIAVISSVAGDRGRQSNYVYGASKAALTAFVSGLRNRLDRHGVNVITIKPGFVITPMTAGMKLGPLAATPEVIAKGIVAAVQKRRDVVYLPWFWRYLMLIVRNIPEGVFKKLNT